MGELPKKSRPEKGRVRRERVGEITKKKSRPEKGRVRRERVGGITKKRVGQKREG